MIHMSHLPSINLSKKEKIKKIECIIEKKNFTKK